VVVVETKSHADSDAIVTMSHVNVIATMSQEKRRHVDHATKPLTSTIYLGDQGTCKPLLVDAQS